MNYKKPSHQVDSEMSIFSSDEKQAYFNQYFPLNIVKHSLLASCPWGPATAHGVSLLTEMYAMSMATYP